MDWVKAKTAQTGVSAFAELSTPVGKSGANESTLLIAIIWAVVIATQ